MITFSPGAVKPHIPHYITVDADVCQIHDMYLLHSGIPSRVEHFPLKTEFCFGDTLVDVAEPKDASLTAVTGKYTHVYVLGNPSTFLYKQLGLPNCVRDSTQYTKWG